jgi:Kdo2-lipid IVA lauroyltransferase/acyltransferase
MTSRLAYLASSALIRAIQGTYDWRVASRMRVAHSIGGLLWHAARARRHVALTNLRLCFPELAEGDRQQIARANFDWVARALLDHSVLARGTRDEVAQLIRVDGLEHLLAPSNRPLLMIAPHFAGLNAGGVRINTELRGVSIYARQRSVAWDEWLLAIRSRFYAPRLIAREGFDLRAAIRAMKEGLPFYYLPDQDYGRQSSIFVPFFGVAAATVPMVPRLAKMTGAKVVMTVTEMTDDGYVLHVEPPWPDFPTGSIETDTVRGHTSASRRGRRVQRLCTDRY